MALCSTSISIDTGTHSPANNGGEDEPLLRPHVPPQFLSQDDLGTTFQEVKPFPEIVFYFMAIHFLLAFSEIILVAPTFRLFENSLCLSHYGFPDGGVAESMCKIQEVQHPLATIRGWKSTLDTIPGMILNFCVRMPTYEGSPACCDPNRKAGRPPRTEKNHGDIPTGFGLKISTGATFYTETAVVNIILFLIVVPQLTSHVGLRYNLDSHVIDLFLVRTSVALMCIGCLAIGFAQASTILPVGVSVYAAGFGSRVSALALISYWISDEAKASFFAAIVVLETLGHAVGDPLIQQIFAASLSLPPFWMAMPFFFGAYIIRWIIGVRSSAKRFFLKLIIKYLGIFQLPNVSQFAH
ncbi:hypothetical protein JHW43_003268 [Diplocarpon mali]|nr:hypothetical protein JHW43_003268 [Diplocarpon mali]